MRLKLLRSMALSLNGMQTTFHREGEELDVPSGLAESLVKAKLAAKAPAEKVGPATSEPRVQVGRTLAVGDIGKLGPEIISKAAEVKPEK